MDFFSRRVTEVTSCLEYFVLVGIVIATRVQRERSVATPLEVAGTFVQRSCLKGKIRRQFLTTAVVFVCLDGDRSCDLGESVTYEKSCKMRIDF